MQLTHMHVYCRELEPALRFLTEGFDGQLVGRRLMLGCPGAEIRFDGLVLFLKEVGGDWAPQEPAAHVCGYNHLGFFVDDLDSTLARLLALPEVHIETEPFVIKDRQRRCAFVTGPSNLYVEVVEDAK